MTPVPASVVRHLATPTHRRTAAEKSPPSAG